MAHLSFTKSAGSSHSFMGYHNISNYSPIAREFAVPQCITLPIHYYQHYANWQVNQNQTYGYFFANSPQSLFNSMVFYPVSVSINNFYETYQNSVPQQNIASQDSRRNGGNATLQCTDIQKSKQLLEGLKQDPCKIKLCQTSKEMGEDRLSQEREIEPMQLSLRSFIQDPSWQSNDIMYSTDGSRTETSLVGTLTDGKNDCTTLNNTEDMHCDQEDAFVNESSKVNNSYNTFDTINNESTFYTAHKKEPTIDVTMEGRNKNYVGQCLDNVAVHAVSDHVVPSVIDSTSSRTNTNMKQIIDNSVVSASQGYSVPTINSEELLRSSEKNDKNPSISDHDNSFFKSIIGINDKLLTSRNLYNKQSAHEECNYTGNFSKNFKNINKEWKHTEGRFYDTKNYGCIATFENSLRKYSKVSRLPPSDIFRHRYADIFSDSLLTNRSLITKNSSRILNDASSQISNDEISSIATTFSSCISNRRNNRIFVDPNEAKRQALQRIRERKKLEDLNLIKAQAAKDMIKKRLQDLEEKRKKQLVSWASGTKSSGGTNLKTIKNPLTLHRKNSYSSINLCSLSH